MKVKLWIIGWLMIVASGLMLFGSWVYITDPFFHYHGPDLTKYCYLINNQRSQNIGIIRNFEYDAMITGTSMVENFKSSEMDEVFGCKSIKVPFSGCSYKEVNDNIEAALRYNSNLKIVVRGLDMEKFFLPADSMREDLGEYPTYLYDNNVFNDVKYLLNRDIVFGRSYNMLLDHADGYEPWMTSFDEYSRWQDEATFGIGTVAPDGVHYSRPTEELHLADEERARIKESIEQNVIKIADKYPDVAFYYFYTPYSAVWWCEQANEGMLFKQLEAEKYITELIIPHKNIHLFSFNNRTDITTDINNYMDPIHYGEWINSMMLRWMYDDKYRLTEDNYEEYVNEEFNFYTRFDYSSLNGQDDYEDDQKAANIRY